MKKVWSIALSFILFTHSLIGTNAYAMNDCDAALLSTADKIATFEKELQTIRQRVDNPITKKYSNYLGRKMSKRLLASCATGCTREQITEFARIEIENFSYKVFQFERSVNRIRVYAIIAGSIFGLLLGYKTIANQKFIKIDATTAAFLSGAFGFIAMRSITNLAGPMFIDRGTQAIFSRLGGSTEKSFFENKNFLQDALISLEGHYSTGDQKAVSRLTSFLNQLTLQMDKITNLSIMGPATEANQKMTANRLAYFLRMVRDFYQDIPAEDVHVLDTVYTFYGKFATNEADRQLLYKNTLDILAQDDKNFNSNQELQDFYNRYLKAWLKTEPLH